MLTKVPGNQKQTTKVKKSRQGRRKAWGVGEGEGATTLRLLSKCHSALHLVQFLTRGRQKMDQDPGKLDSSGSGCFSNCKMEMIFFLLKGFSGEWLINIYK